MSGTPAAPLAGGAGPARRAGGDLTELAKGYGEALRAIAYFFWNWAERAVLRRPAVPFVRQMEMTDCGAACLASTLRLHGVHAPLADLRELTSAGRDGVTAKAVVDAARHFGFTASGVRGDAAGLDAMPQGTILFWRGSHFVVLDRRVRRGTWIVDPARGRFLASDETLAAQFMGVALVIAPGPDVAVPSRAPKRRHSPTLRLLRLPAPLVLRVMLASLALLLGVAVLPFATARAVDALLGPDAGRDVVLTAAMLATATIAAFGVLAGLRSLALVKIQTHLDLGITAGTLTHLLQVPYSFVTRRSSGDLVMRVRSAAALRQSLTVGVAGTILDGIVTTWYLGLLLLADVRFGAIVLAAVAAQAAVVASSWDRLCRLAADYLRVQADSQGALLDLLSGLGAVKAHAAEDEAMAKWSRHFADELALQAQRTGITGIGESLLATVRFGGPLAMLVVGMDGVLSGTVSLPTMIALVMLGATVLQAASSLLTSMLGLTMVPGFIERMDDLLCSPTENFEGRDAPPSGRLDIECRGASFRYSRLSPEVVQDVDVAIAAGEFVAIVGQSGSGKSTLAALIMSLYEPTAGEVLVGGQPLSATDLKAYRKRLAVVTQEPWLVAGSIAHNITVHQPDADRASVELAARRAQIHDDVMAMPMKYDTVVSSGGGGLSGGQAQRLAIARALLAQPEILVLDEATNALDSVTEELVYLGLSELSCTRLVIAHRLSTIVRADRIIVMDHGRAVEIGSHAELLAAGGEYARLWAAQRDDAPMTGPAPSPAVAAVAPAIAPAATPTSAPAVVPVPPTSPAIAPATVPATTLTAAAVAPVPPTAPATSSAIAPATVPAATSLAATRRTNALPLTASQRRFTPVGADDPFVIVYNVDHDVDVDAWSRAVEEVVAACEALRMRVGRDGAEWRQHFVPDPTVSRRLIRATGGDEAKRHLFVQRIAGAERTRPWDLRSEPPVRLAVIAFERGGAVVIALHRMACDGTSRQLVQNAVLQRYLGQDGNLDALREASYAAFAAHEADRAAGQRATDARYWQQVLDGAAWGGPPAVGEAGVVGRLCTARLEVEPRASRLWLSPPMETVAATTMVMWTEHGRTENVITCAVDMRPPPFAASAVGAFTRSSFVRTHVGPRSTLAEVAVGVRDAMIEGYQHLQYDLGEISPVLAAMAARSTTAPIAVTATKAEVGGLDRSTTAGFDMPLTDRSHAPGFELYIQQAGEGVSLLAWWNGARVGEAYGDAFLRSYAGVVHALRGSPDRALADLAAERTFVTADR